MTGQRVEKLYLERLLCVAAMPLLLATAKPGGGAIRLLCVAVMPLLLQGTAKPGGGASRLICVAVGSATCSW